MKIVYFIEGTFNSGGIERIVTDKANWLASKGHDVTIITTDQNGRPDFFPLKGVKRIDFDLMYAKKFNNVFKDCFRRKSLIKKETALIKALIRKLNPDIMISTFRYENNILPKLRDRSHKICEIHFQKFYRLKRKRKGLYWIIDRFLTYQDEQQAKKFEKMICLTEEDKENWKNLNNIEAIPNFIENKTTIPAKLENKKMIAVGRLVPEKGFDRLINAWSIVKENHPDWELNIYGEGYLRNILTDQINNLGLEKVVYLRSPVKNIYEKYLESSGLIITSHHEGFGLVIVEAMEAGLPVVSFDFQCGPKDLIDDGVNGIIVKNGDVQALADAICKLIESPELRKKMGEASFKIAKKFYKEEIMPKWENLFLNLHNNKS